MAHEERPARTRPPPRHSPACALPLLCLCSLSQEEQALEIEVTRTAVASWHRGVVASREFSETLQALQSIFEGEEFKSISEKECVP